VWVSPLLWWATIVDGLPLIIIATDEAQFQGMTTESLEVIKKQADGIVKEIQSVQSDTTSTKARVEDLVFKTIVEKFRDKDDQNGKRHSNLRDSIDKMWKRNEVHTGKSGQWLMRHEKYAEWKAHPQSVLWLQGSGEYLR
jgi:hypothetical protein